MTPEIMVASLECRLPTGTWVFAAAPHDYSDGDLALAEIVKKLTTKVMRNLYR